METDRATCFSGPDRGNTRFQGEPCSRNHIQARWIMFARTQCCRGAKIEHQDGHRVGKQLFLHQKLVIQCFENVTKHCRGSFEMDAACEALQNNGEYASLPQVDNVRVVYFVALSPRSSDLEVQCGSTFVLSALRGSTKACEEMPMHQPKPQGQDLLRKCMCTIVSRAMNHNRKCFQRSGRQGPRPAKSRGSRSAIKTVRTTEARTGSCDCVTKSNRLLKYEVQN